MLNRSALAASIAVTASLLSGAVAFAAITASSDGNTGVAAAATDSVAESASPSESGPSAPDPFAEFLIAAANASTGSAHGSAASNSAAAWWAAAAAGDTNGAAPTPRTEDRDTADDSDDQDDDAPPPAAPTTVPNPPPTTPTTSPPPFNCNGSDDGLSEAVKHAREAYCHGEDEGDD